MCHPPPPPRPALICIVQALIASLASSFLYSQLQMCLLVFLWFAHWLVFHVNPDLQCQRHQGIGSICSVLQPVLQHVWGLTLLSYPWDNLYLQIAAKFSCLWFRLSMRVYLWTSIDFSDKDSNVMPLSPLPTDLYVIVARTRPGCLLLKGQCWQMRAVALKKREE